MVNVSAERKRKPGTGERTTGLSTLLAHPGLWRANTTAGAAPHPDTPPLSTGYAALDQKLSEKGWPRAGLVELLSPEPGMGELRLLAPALSRLGRETERWIVWIDPPYIPYAPALSRLGLDLDRMLLIRPSAQPSGTRQPAIRSSSQPNEMHRDVLWSAELALKSGACSAVLGWFDEARLKTQDVRRLKLAARQGGALAVLFRPVAQRPSMADLKIAISQGDTLDHLQLSVLKQRGGWPAEQLSLALAALSGTSRSRLTETLAQWRASRCIPVTETAVTAGIAAAFSSHVPVQTLKPVPAGGRRVRNLTSHSQAH